MAASQYGVVTTAQLLELGLSASAISRRADRGALHRVARGVYAVGHPNLSQEGRWLAAVLAAGEGAALSHLAAARHWRVWRYRVPRIDVVAPKRRSRAHSARRLHPSDVTVHKGIP